MTFEEMGSRNVRRRALMSSARICLCCLIIGLFLGIALDAVYRPNNILLYINSDGKVALSPKAGDIIRFAADKEKSSAVAKIKVKYTMNLRPCENKEDPDDPTCVYLPYKPSPRLYLFSCTYGGPTGDQNQCFDPHYGPTCSPCGGGGGAGGRFPKLPPILRVPFRDLEGLLGLSPTFQAVPQGLSPSAGSDHSETLRQDEVHSLNASAPPPRVQEYVVSCDKTGKGAIFPVGGTDPIKDPIFAEPNDTITWTAYPPATGFSFTGLEGICGSPTGTNPSCTVKANASSGSIHLTAVGCSVSTVTDWRFTVQKPS